MTKDTQIYTIVSDNEKDLGIVDGMRKRFVDQKFSYIETGAKYYYSGIAAHDKIVTEEKNKIADTALDHKAIITRNIEKGKSYALISLGCGNGSAEKETIIELVKNGYNITYFAIDYSREMVDLCIKNMEDVSCEKTFICGDFGSTGFKQTIREKTEKFDCRLFCLFGFTFINIDQSYYIDIFYSIMKKGDFLLFDILIRKDDTKKTLISFFERYNQYLKNEDRIRCHGNILEYVGIDRNKGSFGFDYYSEKAVSGYVYSMFFQYTEKIKINFKGENITFLPGEKITLVSIKNHNRERFEYFIEEHDFLYVDHINYKTQDYVTQSCYLYAK